MAKVPEVSSEFASWYAGAFMNDSEIIERRWKGVVDTATVADVDTVEVLVRYTFSTVAAANGGKVEALNKQHQALLTSLSGNGSTLDPKDCRRELQLLSAAVLSRLLNRMPDAAIAVLNASFEGARTPDLPMDLVARAQKALAELSRTKHKRPPAEDFEVKLAAVKFEVSQEALAEMSPTLWQSELNKLRGASQDALGEIVKRSNVVTNSLLRQVRLGEEELQMLWWLIGGHSGTLGTPFTDIDDSVRPFILGSELGALTNISPGPASVRSLLTRAGITSTSIKVSEAVNAADADWISEITECARISPVTTPLHFALEKRVEMGLDDAWVKMWATMTGLPSEASMPGAKLAELFYREYLFLNVGD
ncbi:GTPase-associated system all-helical protein GASH [Pseudomonas viridiflava]|uniref:GTPase-associated system all-helical protein GASH n=1 Tax=Pseudomonas viridiflava TaxID=33069 RepID=UPI000F03B100|nr:GTPase-associated system all-helical protein GASH [Pseudomonas viridiflava]